MSHHAELHPVMLSSPSLHETVTFWCHKRIFFIRRPLSLSLVCLQTIKYQFCLASLEVAPSFCCHCCTVFITSLFCLSLPPFSSSSLRPASSWLLLCENDVIWIWWQGDFFFCKLRLRQHFSLRLHRIPPHLPRLAEPNPKCGHNSTLKCLYRWS